MTLDELLATYNIKLASTAAGRHYTQCPRCSPTRSSADHRAAKVLGVTIDEKGACWGCSHCGWTGPEKGSGERRELQAYIYRDVDGQPRFRKIRNAPGRQPRFWLERADGHGGWLKGTKGVDTRILYRLDEVTKAIAEGRVVACAEGEKDADSLWALGIAATCNAHGASEPGKQPKWTKTHSEQLAGADLVVLNDNDSAGYEHAEATCRLSLGIARRMLRLDLAKHWPGMPRGADVSDWLAAGHTREELDALIEAAPDYQPSSPAPEDPKPAANGTDDAAEIEKLARMPPLDYERARKDAGKALGISRLALLDALVKAKRAELGLDEGDGKQGHAIEFPEPEPWPKPVDGAALLDEISTAIRRHVVMPEHEQHAVTLWVTHTYLLDRMMITPRLGVRSPVKGCGKTTLLDVVGQLVFRPLPAANVSASAIFRVVERCRPCLLVDEADSFLRDNEELRGVLNSGHRRGGAVVRNVGDDHEPRAFSTYGACAIALIGSLPGTLTDRSVLVDLTRRKPGEAVEPFRFDRVNHLIDLRRKLARWTLDNAESVAATEPQMPAGLYNRAADNWRPLLAIATVAGGDWLARGHRAALAGAGADVDEGSRLELLLGDIRDTFDAIGGDGGDGSIASAALIAQLVEIVPRPWAEYGKGGKPITQNKLARLLKPLGIAPGRILDGGLGTQVRGYIRAHFEEAFARFLLRKGGSNRQSVTNPINTGTSDVSKPSQPETPVTVAKCEKPSNGGLCDALTVGEGGAEAKAPPAPSTEPADGVPEFLRRCAQCNAPGDARGPVIAHQNGGGRVWLHRECRRFYASAAIPLGAQYARH
jgi:hypothetical protein